MLSNQTYREKIKYVDKIHSILLDSYHNNNNKVSHQSIIKAKEYLFKIDNLVIEIKRHTLDFVINGSLFCNCIPMIDLLIEYGLDINSIIKPNNTTLIMEAISCGREEMVKMLIKYGANVNTILYSNNKKTELSHAVTCGPVCINIIKILLQEKLTTINVKSKDKGQTPLFIAVMYNYNEIAKLLINAGANLNLFDKQHNTVLIYACKNKNYELVYSLIKAGVNINNMDRKNNYTALHIACQMSTYKIVNILLKSGANVNVQTKEGNTPLIYGCSDNTDEEIVNLLLEYNADINITNIYGMHALMAACIGNNLSIVKIIMNAGGKMQINIPDINGLTPIMLVSASPSIMKFLLINNANIYQKCNDNKNAINYTIELEDEECIKIIKKEINWNERKYIFKLPSSNSIFKNIPYELLPLISSYLGIRNEDLIYNDTYENED